MKIKSLLRIINLPFKAFYKVVFPWKNLSKRNQKIVTITSIIVIFIMIPVIFYTLSHLKGAEAAWFNDNWGYRQIVAITNAGSAQTDFQISITLDTATLITAGKMRSDCNDIRITDINGRLIPYWIEESPTTNTCNSSTTKIWTKVPSIPTSGASIYLYYGNPSATSVKNGYKTFEQFDDFNRADNTNVGNNWLETDGAGSAEISSNQLKLSITNTTKDGVIAYKPYTTSSAVAMEYSTKNTTLYRAAQGFFVSLSSWTNIYTQEYATLAPYSTVWINKNYYVTGARQEATITSATTDTTNFYRGKVEILGTTDNYSWSLPGTNNFTDTQASVDNYSAVQNFGFTVWNDGSASNLPVSYIDWFSIRKAATTAPSIAAPTNEEKSPAPVAYWKFDEGTGSSAKDSSSNGLVGTITGATWQKEDQCISGKCLYFNGLSSGDKVDLGTSVKLDPTNFTVSAWVKTPDSSLTYNYIFSNDRDCCGTYNGFSLFVQGGYLTGLIWNSTATSITSTSTIPSNKWLYVTYSYDGSTMKLYINGVLDKSVSYSGGVGTPASFNASIGTMGNGQGTYTFKGFIDEPKLYNYARTAAQIKTDYNSRGGSGANVLGTSDSSRNLTNGLVGYWKMDESSGAGSTLANSSGNGNTGTAVLWGGGNTATDSAHVAGKFGNSFSFDGGDDYVISSSSVSITGDANMGLGGWVKFNTIASGGFRAVMDFGATGSMQGFSIFQGVNGSGSLTVGFYGSNNCNTATGVVTTGTWYHIFATKAAGAVNTSNTKLYVNGVQQALTCGTLSTPNISAGKFYIGSDAANEVGVSMLLDEARIYNRALSPSEVTQLYNFAPGPIVYYNLDEGNFGGSAIDSSGNGLTGTVTGVSNSTGKYGKAAKFNGTSNSIVTTDNTITRITAYTASVWIKPEVNNVYWTGIIGKPGRNFNIWFGNSDTSTGYIHHRFHDTASWNSGCPDSSGVPIDGRTWTYVTITNDGTTCKTYFNGILQQQGSVTGSLVIDNSNIQIGTSLDGGGSGYFKGNMDDIKIYNYARTPGQIVSDMNGGHPNVGSPVGSAVGYWKMDEGYGTVANNSGSQGPTLQGSLNGMSSPATVVSGWSQDGKFGKALSYDGINDYVSTTSGPSVTDTITFSLWVKGGNTGNQAVNYPISLGSSGTIRLSLRVGGTFSDANSAANAIGLFDGTNASSAVANTFTHAGDDGVWHHIVAIYDANATTKTRIFKDGKELVMFSQGITGTLSSQNEINIGRRVDNVWLWPGQIDEVKIYNYVLTASDIKTDYNHGASQVLGSMSDTSGLTGGSVASNSASAAYCIPGDTSTCSAPVADWNFEEKTGVTANDTSGNGNTGTLINSPRWTSGKYGAALEFNGTSQTVSTGTLSTLDSKSGMTIEAWVKPTNITTNTYYEIMRQNNGPNWLLSFQDNGTILSFGLNAGGSYGELDVSITAGDYTDGNWHHITAVYDGSNKYLYKDGRQIGSQVKTGVISGIGATNYIGSLAGSSEWFKGKIDNVKVYDYGRTPAQVAYDYNKGTPVGYWKMDECEGAIAHDAAFDAARGGNNGTLTIGATGTQTSAGTCTTSGTAWGNGATGKYNSSLNFDGTDDVIDAGNNSIFNFTSSDFSISLWVKSADGAGNETLLQRGLTQVDGWTIMADPYVHLLTHQSGAYTYCRSQHPVIAGQWQHWVAVRQGSNVRLYKNGLEDIPYTGGTCTSISNPVTSTRSLTIGNGSWGYFNGQLDDARIYNYALTKQQIQQVYNQGAAVRFGPLTGSP